MKYWLIVLAALTLAACNQNSGSETSAEVAAEAVVEEATETEAPAAVSEPEAADALLAAIESNYRSEENRARNQFRHPYDTLKFFGLKDDMCVVEITPGGGWYAEILAPYLKENGHYIAAHHSPETQHRLADYFKRSRAEFDMRVANEQQMSSAEVVSFDPGVLNELPKDGRVDMVLTFRNAHNWIRDGVADVVLADVYAALKPGGVFGLVDHRANSDFEIDPEARNGYVNEDEMIRMAEAAGFRLDAKSDVNANPLDTADHPNGVWTLPPRSRTPEGEDGAKYLAIGESDRMTLRFIKPAE